MLPRDRKRNSHHPLAFSFSPIFATGVFYEAINNLSEFPPDLSYDPPPKPPYKHIKHSSAASESHKKLHVKV